MQVFILESYKTATGRGDNRKDRINSRKEREFLNGKTGEEKGGCLLCTHNSSWSATKYKLQMDNTCLLEEDLY